MENIIEVKDVAKLFGNQMAIECVDFQVKKGEIFGFLGPSGSGKTTTIKILTGQVEPTSGEVKVFGESVSQLKKSQFHRRIGVLTDNSGLYERLSIYDNLKLYCDLYNVPYSEIDEVLDAVNLKHEKTKRVSTLSKGMTQRVTLARALIHKPELLFLDEPTSALDPTNSLHIHEGLRALNAKGTTIFLTTHDMQEAEHLCDRIAFLNQGVIQLLDTPDRLKKRFSDSTITVELATDEKVVLSAGKEGADRLFDYMNTNQVVTIHSNEPTLGEIFVQVTGEEIGMMISMKRMNAILMKDFKDFLRNLAVSTTLFIPIGLGIMYGRIGIDSIETHFMLINLAFVMIATFVQCCLIAEEKEKNTLRGLMLSPASTTEILGGKSLLTFILTMFVVVITAYFAEYKPENIGIIAVAFVLSSFFYITLGTLLGLFSKSVLEASVIVMPVVTIFSVGSFLPMIVDQYPIAKVGMYLPNIQLIELAAKVQAGSGFGDVLVELVIILAWVVLLFMLTKMIYRKRMID